MGAGKQQPFKGIPSQGYARSAPAIPSAYETILFTGPRERKGFLSQSQRFGDNASEHPGPGNYDTGHKADSLTFKHDSISRRGMGGMASRASRFSNKRTYTGPGPGSYRAQLAEELAKQQRAAHASPPFCQEVPKAKPVRPHEERLPGPGAYSPTETRVGDRWDVLQTGSSGRHAHASAFKAPARNFTFASNTDLPPPGTYNVEAIGGVGSGGGKGGARSCCSSFAARSGAGMGGLPPVIFGDESQAKPSSGPGPGSYNVQAHGTISTAVAERASKPSAAFRPGDYVDRFGRPTFGNSGSSDGASSSSSAFVGGTGRAPEGGGGGLRGRGGAHAASARIPSPSPGVSAPFKSRSAGHAEAAPVHDLARAPGPAYYTPQWPPSHKSFHLNARKIMAVP